MDMINGWLYEVQRALDSSLGDIPFDWRWIAAVIGFFLIWRLFSFGFAIVKFVIVAAIAAAIYAAVVGASAGLAGGGSFFGF